MFVILNGDKLKIEVSLIVEEPDMIIRLHLYSAHEQQGIISIFEKYKGKNTHRIKLLMQLSYV